MKKHILIILLLLIPLYAQYDYPDSARVIGYTHFSMATGETSGNRVSVRDSRGWIHATFSYAWGVQFNDSSEIFYVYSTDNGLTWSQMMNVSRTDSQASYESTLAVDSQNNLHCVWKQWNADSNSWDLYYTMYDGVFWSQSKNITQQYASSNTSHFSSMVVDSNDNLHVVYGAPINNYNIFYIYYDGVSWSSPLNLSNVPWDADCPCIAIDSLNHLHVVWRERITDAPIVYTYNDGMSWSSPEAVVTIPGGQSFAPCIVIDSQDYPQLVWQWGNLPSDTGDVYYSAFNGTSWSPPLNLSNTTRESCYHSLAIDSLDNLYVVWAERTAHSNREVFYRTYNGVTWSNIANLSRDTVLSRHPKLGNPVKGTKVDLIWTSYALPAIEVVYLGLNLTGIVEEQSIDVERDTKIFMINPNPFKQMTNITYQFPEEINRRKKLRISIRIYDSSGKLVDSLSQKIQSSVKQKIKWQAKNLSAGVYFIKLEGGEYSIVKKIIKIN